MKRKKVEGRHDTISTDVQYEVMWLKLKHVMILLKFQFNVFISNPTLRIHYESGTVLRGCGCSDNSSLLMLAKLAAKEGEDSREDWGIHYNSVITGRDTSTG